MNFEKQKSPEKHQKNRLLLKILPLVFLIQKI